MSTGKSAQCLTCVACAFVLCRKRRPVTKLLQRGFHQNVRSAWRMQRVQGGGGERDGNACTHGAAGAVQDGHRGPQVPTPGVLRPTAGSPSYLWHSAPNPAPPPGQPHPEPPGLRYPHASLHDPPSSRLPGLLSSPPPEPIPPSSWQSRVRGVHVILLPFLMHVRP